MRLKGAFFVLSLGLALLGGGCKKNPPIVGTWVSESEILNTPAAMEGTYEADGTCHSVTSLNRADGKGGLTATDKGTWTLEGDKLTEKIVDIDMKFTGPDAAAVKKANDLFAQKKAEVIADANKEPTETIKWEGNDQFSYTRDGKTYTFKRKK